MCSGFVVGSFRGWLTIYRLIATDCSIACINQSWIVLQGMFGGGSRSHCQFTKGGLGHQLCSQHSACKNGCLERFSDAGRALLLSFWSCWDLPSLRNPSFICCSCGISIQPSSTHYPCDLLSSVIACEFAVKNWSSGLISPDSGLSFNLFPSLSCLDVTQFPPFPAIQTQ